MNKHERLFIETVVMLMLFFMFLSFNILIFMNCIRILLNHIVLFSLCLSLFRVLKEKRRH